MGYIYKITNDINNKIYIGKTTSDSIEKRFQEHIHDSARREMEQRPLYNAMNKYGVEHFKIEVIGEYPFDELNDMEIYWIAYYRGYEDGYNATKGGDGKILYDYEAIAKRLREHPYIIDVSNEFGCCVDIIRKIAKLYNIKTKTSKEVIKERYSKAIYQIDPKTGEIIQKFNSRIEATAALKGEENKYKDYHICSVCDGKRKLALGYKWRYADEQ